MHQWFIYILASKRNGTLYTGVTNDIARRVDEHRAGNFSSFTTKYCVYRLVYFETFTSPEEAIKREKNLKAWRRKWKLELIEQENPDWRDLAAHLFD